jgi:hypothetical protein
MKFTKSVTMIAAVAMAISLAAPAFADSGSSTSGSSSSGGSGSSSGGGSGIDQQFLQALNSKGIHMTSSDALSLAHSTCAGLQQGGNVNAALAHIKSNSKLSDSDAMTFGGFAIYAYCRQYMPKKGSS